MNVYQQINVPLAFMAKITSANLSLKNVSHQLFIRIMDVQLMVIIVPLIHITKVDHVDLIHLVKMVKTGILTIFNVFVLKEPAGMGTNV